MPPALNISQIAHLPHFFGHFDPARLINNVCEVNNVALVQIALLFVPLSIINVVISLTPFLTSSYLTLTIPILPLLTTEITLMTMVNLGQHIRTLGLGSRISSQVVSIVAIVVILARLLATMMLGYRPIVIH